MLYLYMLHMLICIHWFIPKLFAFKLGMHSYKIYALTRPWISVAAPFAVLLTCYLFSLYLDFILECTLYLMARDFYFPLVLQVLWWIYMLDLIIDTSLYYFTAPVVTYFYCLIITAMVAVDTFDILTVIGYLLIMNYLVYTYDNLSRLGLIEDPHLHIYYIHLPLLGTLYSTIMYLTLTLSVRNYAFVKP